MAKRARLSTTLSVVAVVAAVLDQDLRVAAAAVEVVPCG
jgi:hypothetical protein